MNKSKHVKNTMTKYEKKKRFKIIIVIASRPPPGPDLGRQLLERVEGIFLFCFLWMRNSESLDKMVQPSFKESF